MLPSISILIPCYNGLPFVLEAVESVLAQATDGVECVVVDDGSSDGSADVLVGRFGNSIRLVRQANGGASAARNRALAESRGELVVWFDADDLLAPDTLTERRRVFTMDAGLEMLVGQVEIFDMETGQREVSPKPPCDEHYLVSGLLARKNLPHLNVMTFRRSALSRLELFDSQFPVSQDYDLWIRAWATLHWRFTPRIFSYQRTGVFASLTRREGKILSYLDTGKVLRKNRRFLRSVLNSDLPWRRAYSDWALDLALHLLAHGRRTEAAGWVLRALATAAPRVEGRALKYLLEAVLPSPLYAALRGASRRLGLQSVP
jgi:glycosyltransferase involved in cell wall biosynthesis